MRFITLSLFATILSAPAFAADLGTYRPGTPYSSTVAGGADVCESHCSGDAQCRGWNYVKPNPRAAGICEFLSSVSSPIESPVSISGENQSNPSFSSRVKPGGTNTVRVGTQVTPPQRTVSVGQTAPRHRVVQGAQPDRIVPQKASTRTIENLSLTEQQNRYRQARGVGSQAAPQPQSQFNQTRVPQRQAYAPQQRPNFRPILDGPAPQIPPQVSGQQFRQPQARPAQGQGQVPRRATGPRHQNRVQGQGYAAPQFQDPRIQDPRIQNQRVAAPNIQSQNFQGQPHPGQPHQGQPHQGQPVQAPQGQPPQFTQKQAERSGSSRPPIGQPIQAPQKPVRPKPSTPSQRLAQLAAQTRGQSNAAPATGPIALNPEQARQSLFGRLNDDLNTPKIPASSAAPTQAVTEQPLDEVLAGGL